MVRWITLLFICLVFMNTNQALPQGGPCIQENQSCLTAPHACCDGLRCESDGWTCSRGSGSEPGPVTPTTTSTTPRPHGSSSSSLYHHAAHLVLPSLLILNTLARYMM